jgi:hypothetical protein
VVHLIGMVMAFVMMKTTMKHASLMVVIAVDPMLILYTAQNVNALVTRNQMEAL